MARPLRVPSVVIIVGMVCSTYLSLGHAGTPSTQEPTAASSPTTSTQGPKAEADTLLVLARQALAEDHSDLALQSFQQALELYRKMRDPSGEAQALQSIGSAYFGQDRYAQAIQFSEQTLKLARGLHDSALTGQALTILGASHKELKDLAKALEYQQQALAIAQQIEDKDLEADVWRRLGHVSMEQQDYPKALSHYQHSLSAAQQGKDKELMTYALQGIGSAYQSLEDYFKALEHYEQALALAQALHDRKRESAVLFALAKFYKIQKEIRQAVEVYRQAVLLTLENQKQKIICASNPQRALGEAYQDLMEDYPQALVYFQQAVRIDREAKQPGCELEVLRLVVDTHQALKDYPKMRDTAGQALALARQLKDLEAEYHLLAFGLGRAHEGLGDLPQALVYSQQALAIIRTLNKSQAGADPETREDEALLLFLIGLSMFLGGESVPESEKMLREALAIYQETHNLQRQVWCLSQLANVHHFLGNAEKQLRFSQQALVIARTVNDRTGEADALNTLGTAYGSLNDYRRAIEAYQEGLAIAREIKDQRLEVLLLTQLSRQFASMGEYFQGLEFGQQAWNVAKNTKELEDDALASIMLAGIHFSLNDYAKANEYFQQTVRVARKAHAPLLEGFSLMFSAVLHLQQDQPHQASALLEQAVTLLKKARSPLAQLLTLGILAMTHTDLKDYPKALATAQEALTIAREMKTKYWESASLELLGDIYRRSGKLHEALRQYEAALATDPNPELPGGGAGTRISMGRAYRRLNQPELAIANYKQGVSGIEDVRRKLQALPPELQQMFLMAGKEGEIRAEAYRELADLLFSQGRAAEAQEVLERLKAQEIKDFTQTSAAPKAVTLIPEEAAIIKAHGNLIAFGNKIEACQEKGCGELDRLLDERDALTRVFHGKVEELEQQVNPRLAKDKATLDPKDFGRKAKELVDTQPGTVLIYPLVLAEKLWILWGTTGGVLNTIEVPVTQAQLEQAVIELRTLLENPASDVARIRALGQQLYAWLMQPMEAELRANRIQHLVFALDRAIRYIPMSVLFDGEHYLVEQYTLSTIVSAGLTDTRDRLPAEIAQTPVLALGLSAAKPGFKALPYVSSELDAIVQQPGIYPGVKFIDDAFDFKALRNHLHGRKILHIATHAAFVPGVKESSFLVLGNGEKLKMTKVEELNDLGDVHLVALSACQTALGEKGQDGVEINAMSYYFLNKGVKAVMASLWAVDDSSTSQLMRKFYSELATAKVTKAQALRQAQLALLKGNASGSSEARGVERMEATPRRYDHPYYWAPFILIGNGG